MAFSTELWIQLLIYAVSVGSLSGVILTRLKHLEKKMDKHNELIERMVVQEQSTKSAHHRIDDVKADLSIIKNRKQKGAYQ